ncbi:MAG: FtsX-like permease family protein [Thermodesulfovibrio sp.]|nr:FtsX-like permease family protein [Thermodesulfovibrio sp.]
MRFLVAIKMAIHDRSTTAGAVLGVVAIIFLVGQQLSVFFGLLNLMSVLPDHSVADAWVMSKNIRNSDSGNLIPSSYIDRIIGIKEVEWAEPILIGSGLFRRGDGSFEPVRLVGLKRPRITGGPWSFIQNDERALLDLESVVVDKLDLRKLGHPYLDEITEIGEKRVRLGAIASGARGFQGTLVFAPLEKVREISRTPPGRYSAILIKFIENSDKERIVSQLREILPNCSVFSSEELSKLTRNYYITNTGIGGSFLFSTSIAIMIGVVIITLTMYTSVLSRKKDLALIRAIGGRKRDIFVIVISQVLFIALLGIFIGFLLLSTLLNYTLGSQIPSYLPKEVFPALTIGALFVSLFGSLLALKVALKTDPASVFH